MSIINHSKRFIFVHVPKTAGTSLAATLSRFNRYCDLEIGATTFGEQIAGPYSRRFQIRKHSTAAEIRDVVGEDVWDDSFTFAFVRHPLSRTYSLYKFLKTTWRNWEGSEVMDGLDTFRQFVESDLFLTHGPDRILRPQVFWLRGSSGGGGIAVDFVGRVERLRQDLATVLDRIGPGAASELDRLPWANRSTERDEWRGAYSSSAVVDRVVRRYEVDFQAFDYSPEGPDAPVPQEAPSTRPDGR